MSSLFLWLSVKQRFINYIKLPKYQILLSSILLTIQYATKDDLIDTLASNVSEIKVIYFFSKFKCKTDMLCMTRSLVSRFYKKI